MLKFRRKDPDEVIPVTFTAINNVFKAQIKVRALRDLSGWANHERRIRWQMKAFKFYWVDEDTAREFQAKGYVEIIKGRVKPVSDDERAEFLSTVTVLSPGGTNG